MNRRKTSSTAILPALLVAGLFVLVFDAIGPFWVMATLFVVLLIRFAMPWVRAYWDMLFGA